MARRVAVVIDLETAKAIASGEKFTIQVKMAKAAVKELDGEIDKVNRSEAEMVATTELAKKQVADLGDKARGTAGDLALLDGRIAASKLRVRELGLEFARTGDAIDSKALGREKSLLHKLEKLREELTKPMQIAGVGTILGLGTAGAALGAQGSKVGSLFADGFVSSLKIPGIAAAIGALVVAALPPLGAIIGGALIGATGTVALAGGILSTIKSPIVQSAAKEFGTHLTTMFFDGEAFVTPVVNSLSILQTAFDKIDISGSLATISPEVEVIASGIADLVTNFMPGFNATLDRMAPFADAAADGLAETGAALGGMISNISSSEGAVTGLITVFKLLNGTIVIVGGTIEVLSDIYQGFVEFIDGGAHIIDGAADHLAKFLHLPAEQAHTLSNALDPLLDRTPHVIGRFDWMARSSHDTAVRLKEQEEAARQLQQELDNTINLLNEMISVEFGMASATQAVNSGWLDLSDTIKENGRHWENNTRAGLANREAVLNQISALESQRQATIANTNDVVGANAEFDRQVTALRKIAAQAGATEAQLNELTGTYTIKVKIDFFYSAAAALINQFFSQLFNPFGKKAAGGPVMPGGTYLVGEQGPELLQMGSGQSGQVYSNAQSHNMARSWSAGSGGGVQWNAQPFEYVGRSESEARLIEDIRTAVSARGGTLAVLGLRA